MTATNHQETGLPEPVAHGLSPLWADVFPAGLLEELSANPFLAACRAGTVSDAQLRGFLIQHHHYSQYFTRYLCSLMGSLTDLGEFKALSHNLAEELSGDDTDQVSHAELYREAMDELGAVPRSLPVLSSTRALIDTMFRYCRGGDALDGLAALCLGAEAIVPIVYGPILDALRHRHAPARALRFFQIHVEEDEQHAIVMREIIDRMLAERPYLRARVVAVGEEMVRLRMAMLSELLAYGGAGARLPEAALAALRADASLGSGNFLDLCLGLSPVKGVEFLYLDKPLSYADGTRLHALSLATLQQYRRSLADWYLRQGVGRDDVVAVCVADGIAPFLHYLALTSLGAAIALINPAMPAEVGAAYMRENGFGKLVVDAHTQATSGFVQQWSVLNAAALVDVSQARLEPVVELPAWWPVAPEDSTLVMLSHTSGTTGVPKAVRFEHRQFFMGKRARIGRFAEGPDERLLTALPQSHSAAISHLETAVLHGIPTYVMGTQEGEAVRAAIQAFAPTTVVAFPKSYMQLVEGGVAEREFATVRRWFSMGDAAHQSHTRRLLAGAPASRFIDAFGSSELGMALFRSESTLDELAPRRAIGRPVDIAVAKILHPETGDEVPPGETGLLAVRSPTITSGYWRQPQRTHGAWRGGYFLTGDVAYCEDGVFYQIDREVDVVTSPFGALYTLQLEEVAQQVDGVCDVAVVGVEGGAPGDPALLALVLPDRRMTDPAALASGVQDALRDAIGADGAELPEDAVAVAVVRSLSFLPVGATGKVLKRLLRHSAGALLRQAADGGAASRDVLHVARRATAGARV
ncbi:AMP-binding protein [Burkholderia stagnalis]